MTLLSILTAVVILAILYATWQANLALRGLQATIMALEGTIHRFELPVKAETLATDDPRIAALETQVHDLVLALSEGIQRVHRSENRVRAVVASARKELAEHGFEHAGVEAEAGELREVDGDPGDPGPVPAVPEDVGNGSQAPSSIPGVTVGELRRAWRL